MMTRYRPANGTSLLII